MVINKIARDGAPSSLRRMHRSFALRTLLQSGGLSRTGLADQLGLSQMAVSRIVRDLMEADLVEETGIVLRENGPGRRQTQLQIRQSGTYAAGIVLSAYSSEVSIVNARGEMVAHRVVPLDDIADGQAAMVSLAVALNALIEELDIPRQRIVGAGVAAAADLDPQNINVVHAGYLGWEPFNLVETVSKTTGLDVIAENIVSALILAETSVGVARDLCSVVAVRSATSIGASILQHGQIVRGHGNRPGRIGHFTHKETALTCSCGRRDCLNCTASGWSVLSRLGITGDREYDPAHVASYARAIDRFVDDGLRRDTGVAEALRSAGWALAGALQVLNQTIEPEAIILAGSMSRVPEYVEGIETQLKESTEGGLALAKLQIGELRAVRAAAMLVLLEKIYSPALDFETLRDSAVAPSSSMVRAV